MTGESMGADALANELTAAKRTLALARFRLHQDVALYGVPATVRLPRSAELGRDRDLWLRHRAALRRVRYLEQLQPA